MSRCGQRLRRPSITAVLASICLALTGLASVAVTQARASTTQQSIIEDDSQLRAHLTRTLATMHELGVSLVKVAVYWQSVAPKPGAKRAPAGFNAQNPAAYPASSWAFYDALVRQAQQDGMQVGFMLTGPAPVWAEGPGIPAGHPAITGNWKPSASAFGSFVHAVGKRYSGRYAPSRGAAPLPRVSWWSIWNEPNYGPDLAPQAIANNTIDTAAPMYRDLLRAAWTGLATSGHSPVADTILFGETAPRGIVRPGFPGNFSGTVPLRFIRALYCVNNAIRPLQGAVARNEECPTGPGAVARFRADNPALFQASGYALHPYEQGLPPVVPTYACGLQFCWNTVTRRSDPDYADFPEIGRLALLLDRLNATYGSPTRFPIWSTEYGWWTKPPYSGRGALPPTTAAAYMNWAEYLSYINPRIRSYDQYLLVDPVSADFASGLELPHGQRKATFDAFELPVFMPSTTVRAGGRLLVWGCVRPGPAALSLTGVAQNVAIQFQSSARAPFHTLTTVTIGSPRGYFETRLVFTQSGSIRLAWTSPAGRKVYSRSVAVAIRRS
jgi:hypothetical protein